MRSLKSTVIICASLLGLAGCCCCQGGTIDADTVNARVIHGTPTEGLPPPVSPSRATPPQ